MNRKPRTGPACPKCGTAMIRGPKAQSGKQRWLCRGPGGTSANGAVYCYSTTNPAPTRVNTRSGRAERAPRFVRDLRKAKRFLITAAQNATPVHEGFLAALETCAKETDRELIVIPLRYKNPTSIWQESQENAEWWVPEVEKYCYSQRKALNKNLLLLGDIKTIPTAETPLTGFEGLSRGESAILGHTKVQLKTIATPQSRLPKILTTTGAVTLRNYTDSKAGKKGEFHHVFGACAVDLDGKYFHLRQINATADGAFIDEQTEYLPTRRTRKAGRPLSLTMGDTHVGEADPKVLEARLKLIERYDPQALVHHDLLNGRSINPHEFDNPFVQLANYRGKARNVYAEVMAAIDFVKSYGRGTDRAVYVVPSNHNDWLSRWLAKTDWKRDPENAQFYLETATAIAAASKMGAKGPEVPDAFSYWVRKLAPEIRCPGRGESVLIGNIEHNFHGDKGPNGARGSVLNMSKLGVKVNIGHVHSPAILGPLFAAGTSTYLDPPYTRGHPGSWLNTDILLYANGKRTLINYIDGKWSL